MPTLLEDLEEELAEGDFFGMLDSLSYKAGADSQEYDVRVPEVNYIFTDVGQKSQTKRLDEMERREGICQRIWSYRSYRSYRSWRMKCGMCICASIF